MLGLVTAPLDRGQLDSQAADFDAGSAILIVDDDSMIRERLSRICRSSETLSNIRVLQAETGEAALNLLRSENVLVLVLDKNLDPNLDPTKKTGIDFIAAFLEVRPALQILIYSSSKELQDVVEAMKRGALGYIAKDSSKDFILSQLSKAYAMATMQIRNLRLERQAVGGSSMNIVGRSKIMGRLSEQLRLLAQNECSVLLLGESGVGKTNIARAIHDYRSNFLKTSNRPFCSLNLTALSADLFERELFGNERGAYTGAIMRRQGFLEVADRGTLFLDEIGDISLQAQVKLLKVIEEKKFYRLGGTEEIHSNFKLICATHKNLELLVERGLFREDLYYRISTFPIKVPTLGERIEDVPDLVQALLPGVCTKINISILFEDIPKDFLEYLMDHPPKGNLRGIARALEHLLVFAPRNDLGRPFLDRWKSIDDFRRPSARRVESTRALTLSELRELPTDVLGEDFPGLRKFSNFMQDKVISEARRKFGKDLDIARVLKIHPSNLSLKLRGIVRIKPATNKREPIQSPSQKSQETKHV